MRYANQPGPLLLPGHLMRKLKSRERLENGEPFGKTESPEIESKLSYGLKIDIFLSFFRFSVV